MAKKVLVIIGCALFGMVAGAMVTAWLILQSVKHANDPGGAAPLAAFFGILVFGTFGGIIGGVIGSLIAVGILRTKAAPVLLLPSILGYLSFLGTATWVLTIYFRIAADTREMQARWQLFQQAESIYRRRGDDTSKMPPDERRLYHQAQGEGFDPRNFLPYQAPAKPQNNGASAPATPSPPDQPASPPPPDRSTEQPSPSQSASADTSEISSEDAVFTIPSTDASSPDSPLSDAIRTLGQHVADYPDKQRITTRWTIPHDDGTIEIRSLIYYPSHQLLSYLSIDPAQHSSHVLEGYNTVTVDQLQTLAQRPATQFIAPSDLVPLGAHLVFLEQQPNRP